MRNTAEVHRFTGKLFVYRHMTFGEWLRKKILEQRISNRELAQMAGLSPTYVGNLVRDYSPNMIGNRAPRPGEDVVERIAKALNAPLDEARLAANYAPRNGDTNAGLFAGIESLSPDRQRLARRQIRAIIDSLIDQAEHDTDYIDDKKQ